MYIYKDRDLLYYRHFGKALKREVFDSLIEELRVDAFAGGVSKIQYHDYYKYRISYITDGDSLIFLFVTGLTDNFDNIKKELIRCKKDFLNLFEDILHHRFDAKTFELFDPTIDSIHRNLRPKISLVGFSGVGKTTITRLIRAEEIPVQHIPTITGDIATIKIGKLHFHLWDFAGQEQFSYLWNNFVKGSDAVLLITDSSLENVEKSKFFLELIKERAPNAHTAVIGNKQDLEESMEPSQIEKIIGLKTYSMIAKESENRNKMIQIIADILDMSAEVSPLLKPLLQRDELTEKATQAIESGDFATAANLFEKISDLCIELGDDSLGKEFYEKSQKIKSMLQKVGELPEEEVTPEAEIPTAEEALVETELLSASDMAEESLIPPNPEISSDVGTPKPPATLSKPKVLDLPKAPAQPKTPAQPNSGPPPAAASLLKAPTPKVPKIPQLPLKSKTERPLPKTLAEAGIDGADILIKPTIPQDNIGLKLNPEDFMIKQRPKTVVVVPKDARSKLKTSPFAHVTNPSQPQPSTSAPSKQEVSPFVPIKPQQPVTPIIPTPPPQIVTPPAPPAQPQQPTSPAIPAPPPQAATPAPAAAIGETTIPNNVMASQQKHNLEQTLMDLKIKKANMQKMALDFDMQELSGEITSEELNDKKNRLAILEIKIEEQIQQVQKMINDLA